ncbi:hypothetical protein [Actinokineospora cianjurensis]|uniref:Uncharacterized protein n=1 Tax=Actinokineospora cianjurensis TaxID=585224 RepID=A0A421B2V4_9PSEU|nr:hypothetical protein [Actinokineospora cianjurensis]RLK58610.1 hypothetical protein CLV68_3081 [Actinokineospora cianjurensis]
MADLPDVVDTRVPAMAWCRHENGDDHVYWSPSERVVGPDVRWPAPQVLFDRRTSGTPSISGAGPGACMAWKGSGGDTHIWYSLWDAAAGGWGPQVGSGFETDTFPTVVRFRGHTLMFWKNSRDDGGLGRIVWSELVGGDWVNPLGGPRVANKAVLGIRTDGVAATWNTHEDALYIAWRGPGTNTDVSWWELDDRTASGSYLWQESGTVPHAQASAPPTLVSDGNAMYLAWRNAQDDHISWSMSVSGNWFEPRVLTDRRTSAGPALGVVGTSDLVMVWKGAGADPVLWWSRLRDGWFGQPGPQQAFPDRKVFADLRASLS